MPASPHPPLRGSLTPAVHAPSDLTVVHYTPEWVMDVVLDAIVAQIKRARAVEGPPAATTPLGPSPPEPKRAARAKPYTGPSRGRGRGRTGRSAGRHPWARPCTALASP
eukprot:6474084-Prymnesium_polylepis.1